MEDVPGTFSPKCFAAGSFGGSLVTPSERLAALPRGSGAQWGLRKFLSHPGDTIAGTPK